MADDQTDVVVVGAGVSGLTAARTLIAAGLSVRIVDKGRSIGGRLATRRIGGARLDHGAQFFTVRGEAFRAVVDEAIDAGVVHVWNHGFSVEGDGYPRFAGSEGMNAFGKWLGRDLPCETNVRVERINASGARLSLSGEDFRAGASSVVLTAPVPQSLAMLDAGGVQLPPEIEASLRAIEYHRVLGLLVTLAEAPPAEAFPAGGVQLTDGPFSFIGDNAHKGISAEPAVTFHVNHQVSLDRWDDDRNQVRLDLRDAARPWLGDAEVIEVQLKTWLYAGPVATHPDAAVSARVDGAPVVFCGDAFAGPKVEGAFNSGRAAADAVLSHLS